MAFQFLGKKKPKFINHQTKTLRDHKSKPICKQFTRLEELKHRIQNSNALELLKTEEIDSNTRRDNIPSKDVK